MLRIILLMLTAFSVSGCAAIFVAGAATTAMMADDRRTLGTQIDDQNIETKASHRIGQLQNADNQASVSVTAYNGIVLLTGQVSTTNKANQIVAIIRKLPKVRVIHNELRINTMADNLDSLADTALTTKVRSLLTLEKGVPSNQIKVISELDEVFLMGMVTREEADKAIAVTRSVSGVKKVIELFEYIEPTAIESN